MKNLLPIIVLFLALLAVLHFTAVGETGEIVEDTTATLCGVVVGRYTYSNAGGGTTHAVALTGHFRSYVP